MITGESPKRAAPAIITTPSFGRLLRRTVVAECYVLASFALKPPLVVFSLYLPPASLGPEAFNSALDSFSQDLQLLTRGGDLNTQLARFGKFVGKHVGTGERLWEASRNSSLRNLLATHNLKVSSTFAPYHPTRTPWPAKTSQEQPSVIDFLLASPDLRTELWPCTRPYPGVRSDHRPIGMAVVSPPPKRHQRKAHWKSSFSPPPDWNHHLPTSWQTSSPWAMGPRPAGTPV